MNNILTKIYKLFGVKTYRTKNIVIHVASSFIFKAGSIFANFMVVPLSIDYLDNENFGVWLTITSFISWFSFFDIGLGNGLRNKFAESITEKDFESAKGYVSTAYFSVLCISLILIILFFIVNNFMPWDKFFNTSSSLRNDLSILLLCVFSFFSIQLVTNLIISIYQADQKHSIQNLIQFLIQIISLIAVWLLTKSSGNSLLIFGIIYSSIPFILLLLLNVYAFSSNYKIFLPTISYFKPNFLKDITQLGFKFFIIQIAVIVLFSTDNYIITRLFGPEEVVPYNIAFKYFSLVTIAYGIITTPFWSSFTEAYTKKDFMWIKNSVKNVQRIWIIFLIITLIMLFFSEEFYYLWVGNSVEVPAILSKSMALFILLSTFNMVYVNFINGVGKIKLQLITAIISMVINIPLSIFFAIDLGLGITGVILATCFCSLYSVILKPMQYYKIINNTAQGIWNK